MRPSGRRPMRRPGIRSVRRPIRRGVRRGLRMPPPPPPALEAARDDVARAHELMEAAQYEEAEALLLRVAALAAARQHHRRAGQLYARVAHAALEGGKTIQALAHADNAIATLVGGGEGAHAVRIVNRMADELRSRGLEAEADTLHQHLDSRLSDKGIVVGDFREHVALSPAPERALPAQCHACLGPVRADEVEWLDDTSAACAYCGTVLKAT